MRLENATYNGRPHPPPDGGRTERRSAAVGAAAERLKPAILIAFAEEDASRLSRRMIASRVAESLSQHETEIGDLSLNDRRNLITDLVNWLLWLMRSRAEGSATEDDASGCGAPTADDGAPPGDRLSDAHRAVQAEVMERLDMAAASKMERAALAPQMAGLVGEILQERQIRLNQNEQRRVVELLLDEMLGLGPLEPLLADDTVNDIMVNGPNRIYVERRGKLERTAVRFRDDDHVMNVARRIVSLVGRRIDESSPMVDARLTDGSRVNIIVPPLAIDGPSISIRKFSRQRITLDVMEKQGNLSPALATVLRVAARARLNVLISGGTGSGKTTLLNAMSQMIDPDERVVTIEDAAELQLQQPHVVRLETRPANLEGQGEVTMRGLVKNALRMRPDRIILGEVRGGEAVDMLQAMNTGHDGSLGTIHANRPREALMRLENMVAMAGINLPTRAVRAQIASALDVIVQISRMRDGMRRITSVSEVVGMEGDVITTQELFSFEYEGDEPDGRIKGQFKSTTLRPHCLPKAAYFGLDRLLLEVV